MKIFTKVGDLIIKIFNLMGMIILTIPKIPDKIRGIDTDDIKDKVDTGAIKGNISKIKNDTRIKEGISKISKKETSPTSKTNTETDYKSNTGIKGPKSPISSGEFTSEEKERTVFILQILAGGFLVVSMLFLFNFLMFFLYVIFSIILIGTTIYLLYTKVKLMYTADFNAYRDFFLMYIAVGIILVLIGSNPAFVMSFSFEFLPSLSILIFALIAVVAVFLIFRMKYHRNFTYGTVIETAKKTAYVKVEYDICSNVKPDTYIVENSVGANDDDTVKVQIEESIMSMGGNKPTAIIEILK